MPNVYSKSLQLSTRLQRPLQVGVAMVVLFGASTVAGDPADDDIVDEVVVVIEEIALPPAQHVRPPVEVTLARDKFFTVLKLLDAFATPNQLDSLLKEKIALVDKICDLTDVQKKKLELAGRGDIKRLTDRVKELKTQFELVKNDVAKINELHNRAQLLENGVTMPGISSDGSLFIKILEQLLTVEQSFNYAPLRAVFRAGGLMRMWDIGRPDEGLAINLTGTAIGNEVLAHVCELPSLKSLDLDDTRITDSGLAHLKRLSSLKKVSLARTGVTVTGVAELHRTLPNVAIEK